MIIHTLHVGPIQTNCYIIGSEETGEGLVIDPGEEAEVIRDAAERLHLTIKTIVNTHAHFDHSGGNAELLRLTSAKLAMHPAEIPLLHGRGDAALFGFEIELSPDPDMLLNDGDKLLVGKHCLQVIFTPGHTPGHISFWEAKEGVLFDGDVLFAGGIGRTDLPGSDLEQLMASLHERLMSLPDDTRVYSGHGPITTIGAERRSNPWL
jgi:hydroxyacylglutathione hydrolase